jgi:hypothetical protein
MCKNRYPWIGDGNNGDLGVLYGFVAASTAEGKVNCGVCGELEFSNKKTAKVQQTNLGSFTDPTLIDFAVPGGGFGDYNGCKDMEGWNVYTPSGPCDPVQNTDACWRYGGFTDISYCNLAFPGDQAAQDACTGILFNNDIFPAPTSTWYPPRGNAIITRRRRISCPKELTDKTGVSNP